MSNLKINNLCKSYENEKVIENFNLEILKKEFLVIVGPSGCGKSTLLRCIDNLLPFNDGEITLDGFKITDKDTAMVFQNYALFPNMKVKDNIIFGLNKKENLDKVIILAKLLKIEKLLNRYPSQLSGGEKQRVAIARAMIRNPKIYLFDEPLSNVDANIKCELIKEIKEIYLNNNSIFIYVTHDQEEALKLATKLLIMDNGSILQYGDVNTIVNQPNSIKIIKFLSSLDYHILEGKIVKKNKCYYLNYQKMNLLLDEKEYDYLKINNYKNKTIFFSFRSNQIVLNNNGTFKLKIKKYEKNNFNDKIFIDFFGYDLAIPYQDINYHMFSIKGTILLFDYEKGNNVML